MKRLSILSSLLVLLVLSVTAASAGGFAPLKPILPASSVQTNMVRLALGGWNHTCSGAADGRMMCWGSNGNGEVGDGTTTTRPAPVYVPGLTGVTAIAAGENHTCALMTGGGVKCWGYNLLGQLGIGSADTSPHPTPADVRSSPTDSTPLSGVIAIAAGAYHTCALMTGGAVKCWGYNSYGQLGDGTTTQRTGPVNVSGLTTGVSAIAGGEHHTCALMTGGGIKCWGRNTEGELGNNSNVDSHTPVDVQASSGVSTALSGATAVDAGDFHTCAVVNGGAKCWGVGSNGQRGDNAKGSKFAPVDVFGLTTGVSAIAGSAYHTCALMTGGGVKCWGYNAHGQLGDGTTTQSLVPVDVTGLASGASAVDTGHEHSCALMSTGEIQCWGYNSQGQLGIGTTDIAPHSAPVNAAIPVATTAAVTSTANPAVVGQTIVLTATVSSGDPSKMPTGNVTFYDGVTLLGTSALNASGQVTQTVTAAGLGAHSITAVYAGDIGFDPSTSPTFSQTIDKASTLTALSVSPNPSSLAQSVLFTATVTILTPGAGSLTGTVTFRDGTTTIAGCGTLALSGTSTANCTLSRLDAGSHAITAAYTGDGSFTQSTSAALNLNVFRLYLPLTTR